MVQGILWYIPVSRICVLMLTIATRYVSGIVDNLENEILCFLRLYHLAVDAVGILDDRRGVSWLVFMQISISLYKNHDWNILNITNAKVGIKGYHESWHITKFIQGTSQLLALTYHKHESIV